MRNKNYIILLTILFSTVFCYAGTTPPYRINTWAVLGMFDNYGWVGQDGDPTGAGETSLQPSIGDTTAGKTWDYFDDRIFCRNYDDYNDLYCYFRYYKKLPWSTTWGATCYTAYANVWVWSPYTTTFYICFGAQDAAKAWWNGGLLYSSPHYTQASRDVWAVAVSVTANTWNRLLIKTSNTTGNGGFYARILDSAYHDMPALVYGLNKPGGQLSIDTSTSMPKGYFEWPYCWLDCSNGPLIVAGAGWSTPSPNDRPEASRFKFFASGGTPPYTWAINNGNFPTGLTLSNYGDISGFCSSTGTFSFTLSVTDNTGTKVTKQISIQVKDRPTKWLELKKLGTWQGGDNAQFVTYSTDYVGLLKALGYYGLTWGCKGEGGACNWVTGVPRYDHVVYPGVDVITGPINVLRTNGMKVGLSYALQEENGFNKTDWTNNPQYYFGTYVFKQIEELMNNYAPVDNFFFDGAFHTANIYEYDALYSMMKTINPDCLIEINPTYLLPVYDTNWCMGDLDYVGGEATYGMTDASEPPERRGPYWSDWPFNLAATGVNVKKMVADRQQFPLQQATGTVPDSWNDWNTTLRSMISMFCEGNAVCLFICYPTVGFPTIWTCRQQMANWMLQPGRKESLYDTWPVTGLSNLPNAFPWGYIVGRNNKYYCHIIANYASPISVYGTPAKQYQSGWPVIQAANYQLGITPVNPTIKSVRWLNTTTNPKILSFTQAGTNLTMNISGVTSDPVDTILIINYGTPDHVQITQSKSQIVANGTDTSTTTLSILDNYNEWVDVSTVTLSLSGPAVWADTGNSLQRQFTVVNGSVTAVVKSTTVVGQAIGTITSVDGITNSLIVGTTFSIICIPGPAATILLTANPASIRGDGSSSTIITAQIIDTYGNYVSTITNVTFSITGQGTWLDGTTVQQQRITTNGTATITVKSTNQSGSVIVTAKSTGLADGNVTVVVIPGTPVKVIGEPNPAIVTANGVDITTITAKIADANNNPIVPDVPPILTFRITGRGTWSDGTIQTQNITANNGIATMVVKPTTVAGSIQINIDSFGLAGSTVSVTTIHGPVKKIKTRAY